MPTMRCAILDDYQNVALSMADWSPVKGDLDIKVFTNHLGPADNVVKALAGVNIVCAMRERTPFPREVLARLPALRLLVTTGARNAAIDVAAARDLNILVCGTQGSGPSTAELTFGLILELTRKIGHEAARLKAGAAWQTTIGTELYGKTLGVVGLGRLGAHVAAIAKAFKMRVLAWSPNLTADACAAAGVVYADKDTLLRDCDIVTIHLVLGPRSRGLIGARDLGLMKKTAYLINTARGPIVDGAALLEALRGRRIRGAGLDVFDVEPLPRDHPLRGLDNVVLTPHLGYVTEEAYRVFYAQTIEDIGAFLSGAPPLREVK